MTNQAAEKLLLAGMIRHPDTFFEYCQYLDEDHFSSDAAQITWLALHHLMINQGAQHVSKAKLVSAAKSLGYPNYLATVRNGVWLDEIINEQIADHEVVEHFVEVKKQSMISNYIQATEEVRQYLRNTSDPLSKIIGKVEDLVVGKVTMIDKGEHSINYLLEDARSKIESIADDPGHVGLDLGFPVLQSRIGQFRNGSVSFL